MRYLTLSVLLCLAACGPSEAERHASFLSRCELSKFEPAQCEILYELKKSSEDAESAADVAVGMGFANAARAK